MTMLWMEAVRIAHEQDRENEGRDGLEHLRRSHQQVIDPAAVIAGQCSSDGTDANSDKGGNHTDHEGRAGAVSYTRGKVTPKLIATPAGKPFCRGGDHGCASKSERIAWKERSGGRRVAASSITSPSRIRPRTADRFRR